MNEEILERAARLAVKELSYREPDLAYDSDVLPDSLADHEERIKGATAIVLAVLRESVGEIIEAAEDLLVSTFAIDHTRKETTTFVVSARRFDRLRAALEKGKG